MLFDWCIALGCLAACFAGGWAFVSSRLLQNFDDKETGVQVCTKHIILAAYQHSWLMKQLVQLAHEAAGQLAVL